MSQIPENKKIVVAFLMLLAVSVLVDISKGHIKDGAIDRAVLGGEEKEYNFQLDVEDLIQDYEYTIMVSPVAPTQEEANHYFAQTIKQIEEDLEVITTTVPIQKSYIDGIVKAKWSFQPFGIVDASGKIDSSKLEEDITIQAEVELKCGAYKRIYVCSFLLIKPQLTETQTIIEKIDKVLEEQLQQEGKSVVELPLEIDGASIIWTENREYITPQVLVLEAMAIVLLRVLKSKMQKEEQKKRLQEMEIDYPDIVSQLSLLLGAGMTTRQAWNRIAVQYNFKKKNFMISKKPVYEAIVRMNGRFAEGVSERMAYEQFRTEIPAPGFHKLMRILLGNLEKGSQGICVRLEEESHAAFEQRILLAKRRGEEASTKMLGPLILMLIIVMGIVMLPALINFQM